MITNKDITKFKEDGGISLEEVQDQFELVKGEYEKAIEILFKLRQVTERCHGVYLEIFEHNRGSFTIRSMGDEIEREAEIKSGKHGGMVLILNNSGKEVNAYHCKKSSGEAIQEAREWVVGGKKPRRDSK